MWRPLVLDASALLADIKDEKGADTIRGMIRDASDRLFMHAVNASEIAYHLIRFGLPTSLAFRLAKPPGVAIVEELDQRLWERCAILKAEYRNLAFGDCVAISLAEILDADLATCDSLFVTVKSTASIVMIR